MEILTAVTVMCFMPFALLVFGYWLGRGAPGWPWALVRREPEQDQSRRGVVGNVYYDKEEYQR